VSTKKRVLPDAPLIPVMFFVAQEMQVLGTERQ
jgi:hypothetical protein